MKRKAKEASVNLYYLKNQNEKEKKSVSRKNTNIKKNTSSSHKRGQVKKNNKKEKINNDKFNFDDEIVIGVTKIPETKKKIDNKPKKKEAKNKKDNSLNAKKVKDKNKTNISKKTKKKNLKVFKYVFIMCALLTAIVCFMLSPIFNITEIKISGNNNITSEQIISLSEIKIGENLYKINKNNVIKKIKQNAYIESVSIKRRIPSIIDIEIKERQPTYMLEYANGYAYINNQGYMLEISDVKIDKPILIGISTEAENIKVGNRLVEKDLIKLENVLRIMESATSNEIERLITKIDIYDEYNYILYMETEGKIVRLGDITDISTKMLHVKAILEKEVGIEGEIIVKSISENSKSRFIQKIN